jgi:hypothetical protein
MVIVPDVIPVTTPEALIEPIAVLLELHAPPGTASVNAVVDPWHMLLAPLIAPTEVVGFTTTELVT